MSACCIGNRFVVNTPDIQNTHHYFHEKLVSKSEKHET